MIRLIEFSGGIIEVLLLCRSEALLDLKVDEQKFQIG